mmetsp:Transcript_31446/g.52503  ORF Transcript_31446/g.52503 Transcript_31446/m.52503 type:complete len:98 (+) Transcript_31446:597-890(+)
MSCLLSIFLPKYQYKKPDSTIGTTQISGITDPTVPPSWQTSILPESDTATDAYGDQIICSQTREELLAENKELRARLRLMEGDDDKEAPLGNQDPAN